MLDCRATLCSSVDEATVGFSYDSAFARYSVCFTCQLSQGSLHVTCFEFRLCNHSLSRVRPTGTDSLSRKVFACEQKLVSRALEVSL